MENKNITDIEINKITESSPPREKAFYTIIRQSGLRPNTIRQLKIKHLEKIRESDTPIPCKIDVPRKMEKNRFGRHPSFIAEESVKYLKKYLTKRELRDKEKLTPESLLFTLHNKPNKQINIREMNRTFKKITYKVSHGKSSDLQLNTLREFFKQKSTEMGHNHVNYLMGNMNKEPNGNYTPEEDEFYRKLYREIIMDSLEIEPLTKSALRLRDNQIKELKQQLEEIEETIFPKPPKTRVITDPIAEAKKIREWLKEHPEEAELGELWQEEMEKQQMEIEALMDENPDEFAAFVYELKNKIEAIERILQTRKQKNQQTNQNSNTETTKTT